MRPAATFLTDATAHHQHVDDATVIHVHVIPVVQTSPEDDHALAMGLFGIAREFPRDRDDLFAFDPGDLFGPCRGIGHVVVEVFRHPVTAQTTIKPVIRAKEVKHRRDHHPRPIGERDLAGRDVAGQHLGRVAFHEIARGSPAEIGEIDADNLIMIAIEDLAQPQLRLRTLGLFLKVPLAFLAPTEPDGAVGRHDLSGSLVIGNGFPVRVVRLAQMPRKILGAQHPARNVLPVLFIQPHQHRHVGVFAGVILEILGLPVEVIFAQDDVAHCHGQRGIGAGLRVQPDVAEFGGLGIVGADHGGFGAAIADLGIEMGVRRARLRHVRAPEHQETRVIPVGRFRNVGLFAPCLGGSGRKVAIPVVEGHAGAAQQAQIPRPCGIADHRHGGDRREAEHPVRSPDLCGMGIGGGDDLGCFVPSGAHEPALAARLGVGAPQDGIVLDRGPCGDRRHRRTHLAPGAHQAASDQRVFHAVGAVKIPAIGRPPRTAARFMVGQARTGARIVGLLGFPGHDAGFDIDFPRTGPGAVHPMGGAHDLVVAPAVAVGVLPVAVFRRGLAPTIRELLQLLALEEVQFVEQMAHLAFLSLFCGLAGRAGAAAFDVVQKATGARVDGPGDRKAEDVEDQEQPQRTDGRTRHGDG